MPSHDSGTLVSTGTQVEINKEGGGVQWIVQPLAWLGSFKTRLLFRWREAFEVPVDAHGSGVSRLARCSDGA